MMRRSQREYNPSAIEQAAKRNWNEAWSYQHDNARRWFFVAVGSTVVSSLSIGCVWYAATLPKSVPYVIDRSGPSQITARLEARIPEASRIKGHLKQWVEDVFTVTSDSVAQALRVDQAYAWIDTQSQANDQLITWYTANNPYERAKKYTVSVEVNSVISQGGDSWLIDWTEIAYPREPGKIPQRSTWRMSVIIHVSLPEKEAEIFTNWDGVFVQFLHIAPQAGGA